MKSSDASRYRTLNAVANVPPPNCCTITKDLSNLPSSDVAAEWLFEYRPTGRRNLARRDSTEFGLLDLGIGMVSDRAFDNGDDGDDETVEQTEGDGNVRLLIIEEPPCLRSRLPGMCVSKLI